MEKLRYIPKTEMKDAQWYHGVCRNAHIAMWDKDLDKFRHLRYKFGYFMEEIEHFDDVKETRFDGFIPVKEVEEIDMKRAYQIRHEVGY